MISNEAVNRAIAYILSHIAEDISVDEVARHIHFSKHNFSRMFQLATGESVYEFIKRVKMEQSAFRLKVETGRTVTDIGANYGYSSSNYSSTFKKHHNMSPVAFRRSIVANCMQNPIFSDADIQLEPFEVCSKKITVETLPDYRVIYERRIGNDGQLSQDWGALQKKYEAYCTEETLLLERTYDDPSITEVNGCLYDIYMSVSEDCQLPNTDTIQGGKFAIYHFKKVVSAICAVSFLFSGINTIASFYFTSIGRAKESAMIFSARGVVVLLALYVHSACCLGNHRCLAC